MVVSRGMTSFIFVKIVHPIWNETFYFESSHPCPTLESCSQIDSYLIVQCMDHDVLSSHDFLGQCSICLDGRNSEFKCDFTSITFEMSPLHFTFGS